MFGGLEGRSYHYYNIIHKKICEKVKSDNYGRGAIEKSRCLFLNHNFTIKKRRNFHSTKIFFYFCILLSFFFLLPKSLLFTFSGILSAQVINNKQGCQIFLIIIAKKGCQIFIFLNKLLFQRKTKNQGIVFKKTEKKFKKKKILRNREWRIWFKNIQNKGRWNYSALANRLVSIYRLGF